MWTGIRANAMVGVQAGFKFIEFQAHPQSDYDDIHTFLTALKPEPSPYWVNGQLTPDAVQGKAIFESAQTRCLRMPPARLLLRRHQQIRSSAPRTRPTGP